MFCAYCGREIDKDERFCAYCGQSNAPVTDEEAYAPQPAITFVPPVNPTPDPFNFPLHPSEPVPAPIYEMPVAPIYEPEPQPAAPVKKKKRAKPILITILALVLVAAIAVAGFLVFGKKTVYLVTKTVVDYGNYTSTTRYDYDEDGRLTKIKHAYEFDIDYYSGDYEIAYSYNDDGSLKYCTFKTDGESVKIEYVYKKGTLSDLKIKSTSNDSADMDFDVECTKEGQLEYVALLDEDGDPYRIYEFKYHDNGVVKKSTYTYGSSYHNRETVNVFNEDGKVIERIYAYDGEQSLRYVYDYDEEGRQILQESYNSEDELQSRMKMEYTFKKSLFKSDKLTGMVITVESRMEDGDLQEVTLTFECEWDGKECTLTVDDIDGDREAIRDMEDGGFDEDDFRILLEYDENGNLLKSKLILNDDTTQTTTYTYEEVKVPRKYKQISPENDPMYLYYLLNG